MSVSNVSGKTEWRFNGVFRRKDRLAVGWPRGTKEWWMHGLRHREDGPALETPDGSKEWWLHGYRHREDGPACIWRAKYWYLPKAYNGAFIPVNGIEEWWVNNVKLVGRALLQHQQSFLSQIIIAALLPLDLPPYVLLEILQFAYPFINEMDERVVVRFLQGARASANRIKH